MISAENIRKILLYNWNKNRAANFYIVCSRSHQFLSDWMKAFCIQFLSQHLNLTLAKGKQRFKQGHPDLLYLTPPKDGYYKMEDKHLEKLIRGQYFHPMELPRKIFVVTDAHKIRQDYASKLLKTLEEPHPLSSIFFLNPHSHAMLPTIESRSIILRLPHLASENFALSSPYELYQNLKTNPSCQAQLLTHSIDKILNTCEDFRVLDKFQYELDWYEKSATFHNNIKGRFFGLLNLSESIVPKRR